MTKMKKSIALYLFLITTTFSCNDTFDVYKLLDFDFFLIEAPSNWDKFPLQGYDSKVGGMTNSMDTLIYDFGWYSDDLSNYTTDTHLRTVTTIDGYDALIVQPLIKGEGLIGVTIQVDSLNRFTMTGYSDDEPTILRIFRSIKFD